MAEKKYSNDDITIIWKPDICTHSGICFKGLPNVFNPKKRPWVSILDSDTETIIKQIDQCPSGALSYEYKNQKESDGSLDTSCKVEIMTNGPLLVHGAIEIVNGSQKGNLKNRVTAFCRCGASNNKPYCDGSHTKIGFKD